MKPEFPHVITSSLRSTFNSCHKKFHYETILGTAPQGRNVHLEFGSAYAAALERFRLAYYGPDFSHLATRDRFFEAATEGFVALLTSYGDYTPEETATKNFDRLVGAYIHYLTWYPPETDHVKPAMFGEQPRVEFSFLFELPGLKHPETNDPLLYAGRFDMLAEWNGALIVFDDKTTGQMGATWPKQWMLRSQFTGYCYGAHLADKPVIGAIVRGMCILKTMFKTAESIQYRPQWLIDRWKERLIWDVERMLNMWKEGYWPHTGEESGTCSSYGGCPFVTLCTAYNEEAFRKTYYKEYRWDPLAREDGQIEKAIQLAREQGHVFTWN